MKSKGIGFWGATSMVVANMVGTGVFTSLGYQLYGTHDGFAILMIWLIGGIVALFGAFAYAEIANRLLQNGGEFYFLSEIYHPIVGYMAGFVSATVGFAAPVAGACLAFGAYLNGLFDGVDGKFIGAILMVLISVLHSKSIKVGMLFQKISTLGKIIIIGLFVGVGFIWSGDHVNVGLDFTMTDKSWGEIWSNGWFNAAFSVSLVWVSFAYSGWNASAYIAGSIENPEKNLTRSIVIGTLLVILAYLGLNSVFLLNAPIDELQGKKEVGLIAANYIFGSGWGKIMGGIISVLLISTISSMIFTGPRVLNEMFKKLKGFSGWAVVDSKSIPVPSIFTQLGLSLILLYTLDFESLIYYVAFTLSFFTILTVFGLFVLRLKFGKPQGYKAFGYPITPLIFIVMTSSVAWFFITEKPFESLLGLCTGLLGAGLYFFRVRN
jgi:APA family basic amino acid/polyamine antiporter